MTKFMKPKIQIREFLVYCIGLKRKRSKRRRISWGRRRRRTRFGGWQQGFLKIWLSRWICTAMIEERGNIVNTWPRFLHFISFLNKFDIFTFEIQDIFWISDNFLKIHPDSTITTCQPSEMGLSENCRITDICNIFSIVHASYNLQGSTGVRAP